MPDQTTQEEIAKLSARVSRLERTVEFLLDQLKVDFIDSIEDLYPEIVRLKRQGNVLNAIKLYREQTGVGLEEAKRFVDSL